MRFGRSLPDEASPWAVMAAKVPGVSSTATTQRTIASRGRLDMAQGAIGVGSVSYAIIWSVFGRRRAGAVVSMVAPGSARDDRGGLESLQFLILLCLFLFLKTTLVALVYNN